MSNRKGRIRRVSVNVEPLEGRVVLSTAHFGAAVNPAALINGASYLFINGTLHGKAHAAMSNPDAGSTVTVQGQGKLSPFGSIHFSGSLHGTGFISSGNSTGTLTITNKKGTVTLDLEGPSQPGFTPPQSGTYQFSVASGTGAYSNDLGSGTVDVKLTHGRVTLTFHGAPNRF
jgi:hypothetical protein